MICPRCQTQELPVDYPSAISRYDNKTKICSNCGTDEALMMFVTGFIAPPSSWPIPFSKEKIDDLLQQLECNSSKQTQF